MMRYRHILLLTIVLLTGCGRQSDLKRVLSYSGENRPNLQAVLDHYAQSDSTKLQYQAARFLIENMGSHYSWLGENMQSFILQVDSMYSDMPNSIRRVVYGLPQRLALWDEGIMEKAPDAQHISAGFLIRHIDNRFAMWDSCPWLHDLTFDEFCEYLLPYRIMDEPVLEELDSSDYLWRDLLREVKRYNCVQYNMDELRDILCRILANEHDIYRKDLMLPEIGLYSFECLDDCLYNVSFLRGAGIPCTIDFVSDWPTRNGRHYWRVLIDPHAKQRQSCEISSPRAAKIFRWTYSEGSLIDSSYFRKDKSSFPLLMTEPCTRDVSHIYLETADVLIKPSNNSLKNLYLAVFNDLQWKPVAHAGVRNGKAQFKDMGKGIVYVPVSYDGRDVHIEGHPFLLDTQGKIKKFIPNGSTETLCFHRKYPMTLAKYSWSKDIIGCRIEASDSPDFTPCDTLYTFEEGQAYLGYSEIPVQKEYRCWRLSHIKRIQLGDLLFLDENGQELKGNAIAATSNRAEIYEKAFDNDILSYSNAQVWMGMDFGQSVYVDKIRLISRNDDNAIRPGETYELSYWDADGEHCINRLTADTDSIIFDQVPCGALLWLKDLTAGAEERILSSENGKIVFW